MSARDVGEGSCSSSALASGSNKRTKVVHQLRDSLYEFYQPEGNPSMQIVFFHGIHSEDVVDAHVSTWESHSESKDGLFFWPQRWLAEEFPSAHIFTAKYSGGMGKSSDGKLDIYLIAENLLWDLVQEKVGQMSSCPVVLVGHCFGGIIIKQLCLQASKPSRNSKEHKAFIGNVRGVFYYGTPHHGFPFISEQADLLQTHLLQTPLLNHLKILSKEAGRLKFEFDHLRESHANWQIHGIGESLPTKSALFPNVVAVPEASAREGDSFSVANADHTSISKPTSKIDKRFFALKDLLHKVANTSKEEATKCRQTPNEDVLHFTPIDLDKHTKTDDSYYMVPFLQVSDYVERIDLLESVKSVVQQRRKQGLRQVVVLLGMGGQGKSQLAMEYCRIARLSKEFQAIFWIDASSIKSAHRSFERIALKIASPLRLFGSIEEKIAFVKDTVNGWDSRWLLVFDNYDTPNPDFNVATFFPSSPFGTILVTSRHEDSKRLGKVIPLSKMTEQESLQLLFCRSENELTDESMETGKSIVTKLEFLPLAIDQAGAFISAQKLPLTLFLEHFDLQKEEILKYTPALTEYRRILDDGKETALNVFTTWELSFQQIQKDEIGEKLRSFLTTTAFFNTRDIGEDLFHGANDLETVPLWIDAFISEGAWDSLKYRKALAELSKLSLLNFAIQDAKQCRFYLHPLIAEWLRLRVGQDIRRLCTIESCYLLAKLIESTNFQSCGYAFRLYLLEHVDDCLNNKRTYSMPIDEDGGFAKILTIHLGRLFWETSHYREGISLLEEALPTIETAYGKDHVSTLNSVNNLGILYHKQGKLVEAKEMFERALAGFKKALGKDHSSTLNNVHNLGLLYYDQGKLAEAEEMYMSALVGKEKALGKDHASTLDVVNDLGILYRKQGKLAKCEEMYKRALAGREKAFGKDHSSTVYSVNNLGLLYSDQGKLAEAKEMYERALAGKEKALGKDHASTLEIVNNLGFLYFDQGKLAEAEEMYERALARKEKALGKDHALTLETVNNLGLLYFDQGKLAEAEVMYERALAGREKARGKDHASTLDTVNNLGILYREQGKLLEAEEMHKGALAGQEKALGKDHPSTVYTVNSLGVLYTKQGKLAEAEEMYKRALARSEKSLGRDNKITLDIVCNMAKLMEKQDDLKAASKMFERAFFGYTNLLGANSYKTIDVGHQLERINHLQQQKKVNTKKGV